MTLRCRAQKQSAVIIPALIHRVTSPGGPLLRLGLKTATRFSPPYVSSTSLLLARPGRKPIGLRADILTPFQTCSFVSTGVEGVLIGLVTAR